MQEKMIEAVFSYPKLMKRLENAANKTKVLGHLAEIHANVTPFTMNCLSKFLDTMIAKLYDGIDFDIPPGMDLQALVENNNVVFVPNHQSHADYVVLNYLFYRRYKIPVYIAGGDNLNIFPIGGIFRQSGCFFIRRTFGNDILYKMTLEAYLYYLLKIRAPIEFFFEGGRSRSGKLLPPRFGLYQMLIEAHSLLPEHERRPLLFVPTTIIHEYVPEQRTLTRELEGASKQKESFTQLIKIFKIFSKRLGIVHIRIGKVVPAAQWGVGEGIKKQVQQISFECFREVGRNMSLTPTSLLAIILLDGPVGALKWQDIIQKAETIIDYCQKFSVPLTSNLDRAQLSKSMENALDILIVNRKVNVIGSGKLGHVFYSIRHNARLELLYFKNTVLHHFLVPWLVHESWIKIFNGTISSEQDLQQFYFTQLDQLKYEFYLPRPEELTIQILQLVGEVLGRSINNFSELFQLTHQDLFLLGKGLGEFGHICTFLQEGYYLYLKALKALLAEHKFQFTVDELHQVASIIHQDELTHGRIIKYRESLSKNLLHSTLDYFQHLAIIEQTGENRCYLIPEGQSFDNLIDKYARDLADKVWASP